MGQLLETHLGFAAQMAGIHVKSPVFEGFPEKEIWGMMKEQGLPEGGKFKLYDGRNGNRFDNPVVVGYIYMMKLSHLVADKIHARAVGPYSLVTQQPLGGKAQMGGHAYRSPYLGRCLLPADSPLYTPRSDQTLEERCRGQGKNGRRSL